MLGTLGEWCIRCEVSFGHFFLKKIVLGGVAMGRMEMQHRSKGPDVYCKSESWK